MNNNDNNFFEGLNNRPIRDLDDLSPAQMHYLLYDKFGPNSSIELQSLSDSEYKQVPILNQICYLAQLIAEKKEIRLTKKGFLPVKIVADIYKQGFLKDDHIESGISKLYKETDADTIHLTRILIEQMGIAKKRHGKLSLTKKGNDMLTNKHKLMRLLFDTFATKFNWAYFDGHGQNNIGQFGLGFSLVLLSKYGDEKMQDSFYADKYFTALPRLLQTIEHTGYATREDQAFRCYSLRTFPRFLAHFGLVEVEVDKPYGSETYISKTSLFSKFIHIQS